MDNRTALRDHSVLAFPSMTVTVEGEIGRGSNAIVYKGSYPDLHSGALPRVIIKELFPLHRDGAVYRDNTGALSYGESEDFFAFHKSSFEAGNLIHLSLLENSPDEVGGNINTFFYNNTIYTLLNYNNGRSLEEEIEKRSHSLEYIVKTVKGILHALSDFHKNGILHLDISPDNVMLVGSGERERVMLIDYNSAAVAGSVGTSFSIKAGYSAPEVQNGDVPSFAPSTDLYSVSALFIRWIRGYPLTPFEALQRTPPEISSCELLRELPQTVISMVREILYKGLAPTQRRRYATAEDMLSALSELEDRIQGVGITHWALYEAGKRTVSELIKSNTALHYLNNTEELFPIYLESDAGRAPISAHIDEMIDGGANLFVTAPGGMGKTTSMLSSLKAKSENYSPLSPAIIYIPLYGRAASGSNYVTDKILENLHFKSDVRNYDEARHRLHRLFSEPLGKENAARPTAILFLDGLNEVSEGVEYILEEITRLSKLGGVRIYVTSRTKYQLDGFSYRKISYLTAKEEQEILSRHHLLTPDSREMRELLKTPIMLSMFLDLSRKLGRQPSAKTADELIEAYIFSLIQKEAETLPEGSHQRIKLDVSVKLVLPMIAYGIERKRRSATDADLFKSVSACYRMLRRRSFAKAFPEWIGSRAAIFKEADSRDEWYDVIVRDLLWRRLGMLIRNERGRYIVAHQIIADHLIGKYKKMRNLISPQRKLKRTAVAVTAMLVLALGAVLLIRGITAKVPYETEKATSVMKNGVEGYRKAVLQSDYLSSLIRAVSESPVNCNAAFDDYYLRLESLHEIAVYPSREFILPLLISGNVMEWTGKPLADDEYLELVSLTVARESEYAEIVKTLDFMFSGHILMISQNMKLYFDQLLKLTETDADIAALLYAISCREHVDAMLDALYGSSDKEDRETAAFIDAMLSEEALRNVDSPSERDVDTLVTLLLQKKEERDSLLSMIKTNEIYKQYEVSLPANPPNSDFVPPFVDLNTSPNENGTEPDGTDSSDTPENDENTPLPDASDNGNSEIDEGEDGTDDSDNGNSEIGEGEDGTDDSDNPTLPDINPDVLNPAA